MPLIRARTAAAVLCASTLLIVSHGSPSASADDSLFGGVKDLFGSKDEEKAPPRSRESESEESGDLLDIFDSGGDAVGNLTGSDDNAVDDPLTDAEIGSGLREAHRVGTEFVVSQLGRTDGFNLDPAIHIPLPDTLTKVRDALELVGMTGLLDDLELRLNRAAEIATPIAKNLFFSAIEDMTLRDVRDILNGPEDAATQYFQSRMSAPLSDAMRPIVDDALAEAGAIRAYDNVMGEYEAIPFVPDVKADLTSHVLRLGIAGIFHYIAIEEAEIRRNPAKRTTELLRRVFG